MKQLFFLRRRVALVVIMGLAVIIMAFIMVRNHQQQVSLQFWNHSEIIGHILRRHSPNSEFSRVLVISDHPNFTSDIFNSKLKDYGQIPISFHEPSGQYWFNFVSFIIFKTATSSQQATPLFKTSGDEKAPWPHQWPNQKNNIHKSFERSAKAMVAAYEFMRHRPAWFIENYKEEHSWRLPDGSQAVLYRLTPSLGNKASFLSEFRSFSLAEMNIPPVFMSSIDLKAVPRPLSQSQAEFGPWKEIRLSCEVLKINGAAFRQVRLRLIEPHINMALLENYHQLQFISLEQMDFSGRISSHTVVQALERKFEYLKDLQFIISSNSILLNGRAMRVPFHGKFLVQVQGKAVVLQLKELTVFNFTIPSFVFGRWAEKTFTTGPNIYIPFRLNIKNIWGDKGDLCVTSS